ncbi:unnamed protein product [Oppiella nova]|uniref:Cytochrome P450 n=1 Tax=Oppiella nova TaxID=334625 RepID=A0A7R9Q8S3_9ACAR|nr:unnamed protein product [Oppiella nova]CAG2158120.1 unnamed protein product [Oppiella nova]
MPMDIQQRLYDEITASTPDSSDISYEALTQMPYLDAVVSESLRLYPPAVRLVRQATSAYSLGETGISIEPGQHVEIPIYNVQHSGEYYDNPEKFDPDRFMPENKHKLVPYTFMPFGLGPRTCIGMRFGLLVMKCALAHFIMRYRVYCIPDTDIPLQYKRLMTIRMPKRCMVGIERRIFLYKNYHKWTKLGIKGPKPIPYWRGKSVRV